MYRLRGSVFLEVSRWPILLIIAPLLCYVRLWLNMLDGMVAIAANQASRRGEILNDLPDRASDILIFAGVAHSGLARPILVYWTIIFALLTAYVGTLGQAVGARREFGGLMSKPWRMVALHIGAWVTFALIQWRGADVSSPTSRFSIGLVWPSLPVAFKPSGFGSAASWRQLERSGR